MQHDELTHGASAGATSAAFVASFDLSDKVFSKCAKWSRKWLASTAAKPTSDKGLQRALVLGMCTLMERIRAADTLDEVMNEHKNYSCIHSHAQLTKLLYACTREANVSVGCGMATPECIVAARPVVVRIHA